MKTSQSTDCRQYQRGAGVVICTLKGSWMPGLKPTPTFFAGPDYHGMSRSDAARTLKQWRKIS